MGSNVLSHYCTVEPLETQSPFREIMLFERAIARSILLCQHQQIDFTTDAPDTT